MSEHLRQAWGSLGARDRRIHYLILPNNHHEAHRALLSHVRRHKLGSLQIDAQIEASSLADALKSSGGFSVHDHLGDAPSSGYMVSNSGSEEVHPTSQVMSNPNVLEDYYNDHQASVSNPGHYFGGWVDSDSGNTYLDVSQHYPSEQTANDAANVNQQKAYYDIGSGESKEPTASVNPTAYASRRPVSAEGAWKVRVGDDGPFKEVFEFFGDADDFAREFSRTNNLRQAYIMYEGQNVAKFIDGEKVWEHFGSRRPVTAKPLGFFRNPTTAADQVLAGVKEAAAFSPDRNWTMQDVKERGFSKPSTHGPTMRGHIKEFHVRLSRGPLPRSNDDLGKAHAKDHHHNRPRNHDHEGELNQLGYVGRAVPNWYTGEGVIDRRGQEPRRIL